MQYIDIVNFSGPIDKELQKRLGFSKILTSGDVDVIDAPNKQTKKQFLINSTVPNVVYNLMKANNAIGLLIDGNGVDAKMLAKVSDAGKLLVFNAYYLTISERDRIGKIHKMRKNFRNAAKLKAKMAIVTLAPNEDYLMSSIQLLEVANLITLNDAAAKKMVSTIGEMLNDTKA